MVSTTQEKVPDLIGDLLSILVILQSYISVVIGAAHAENDKLAVALTGLDGVDDRLAVLETSGTGIFLSLSGLVQSTHLN